jgi:hypothetical protein
MIEPPLPLHATQKQKKTSDFNVLMVDYCIQWMNAARASGQACVEFATAFAGIVADAAMQQVLHKL